MEVTIAKLGKPYETLVGIAASSVAIAIKRFSDGNLQYAEQQSIMKIPSAGSVD